MPSAGRNSRKRNLTMSVITSEMQVHWHSLQPLFLIRDEAEYDEAIATLNALLDEVGNNEQHPLSELLNVLGTVIHAYEEKHYPIPECSGIDVLQALMEEHQLEPAALPELGAPNIVAQILNEERELTVSQIRALAARFRISPAAFV